MKKRTLNQTWVLCLRMWRWVSKEWKEGTHVHILKDRWIKENGFKVHEIRGNCFFCNQSNSCGGCPGRLIEGSFQCSNDAYAYEDRPVEFYKELLRLNRIRKAKK